MTALLEAHEISIRFGGVVAADGISLSVMPREILAIVGQNGAGKSTFLNICTGYIKAASGHILFDGQRITGLRPRAITRRGIARAFQHPQVFEERTVLDNVRFAVAARHGIWRPWLRLASPAIDREAEEVLAMLQLDAHADQSVIDTSEGVRKLLDISMALALRPKLLLMDEPTSGVSTQDKYRLMDTLVHALRRQGTAAVFVEHDMEVVTKYSDRVAVWVEGGILTTGPAQDVLIDPDVQAIVG